MKKTKRNTYVDWWKKPISSGSLSVFRILFGIFIWMDAIAFYVEVRHYFRSQIVYFKYPGFAWWPSFDLQTNRLILVSLGLMGIWIALGWWVRTSAFLAMILLFHLLFQDASFYLNHLALNLLICFLFIFIPTNRSYKLTFQKDSKRRIHQPIHRYHLHSIQGIFFISYFYSGIEKIRPDWLNGDIVAMNMAGRSEESQLASWIIRSHPAICVGGAWAVLTLELLAPFGILWSKSRIPTLMLLFLFHGFNDLTLNIGLFSYLMIFAMVLYFEPDWPEKLEIKFLKWYLRSRMDHSIKPKTPPQKQIPLKEGLDFYLDEQGNLVFTESYHLKRGHCCKNSCRHCPFNS